PGDAVTNSAFQARDGLRAAGVDSDVFARFLDARLEDEVKPLDSMPDGDTGMLVYHASIGEPEAFEFLHHRPERLALMYHNISPAEAFAPYDARYARLLEGGRRELAALVRRADIAFAASRFNAAGLEARGYEVVGGSPRLGG